MSPIPGLRHWVEELIRRLPTERGQGLVEYALIIALISIVMALMLTTAGAFQGLASAVASKFNSAASSLS